ncbi:MAG: superoxide dismutase [Bacteroidales bacterium]|jgi:Fe-Mn family superoxide dismutase|nr:superoxide dismutase [Bacteroidales bacterium]
MAKFTLPALPYAMDALEPYISKTTLEFHYGKHHQNYVNTLNTLIEGTEFENLSLEQIIERAKGGIFNNAAQVWNHTFYWNCMTKNHQKEPKGKLKEAIDKTFGSFSNFKEEFTKYATTLFGSGWCWLVMNKENKLEIVQTSNAGNPITEGKKPILVCDVWEHAYYLDKQNARPKYVTDFFELIDWGKVEKNF